MNGQNAKKIILAVDDMPLNLAAIKNILQNDFDIRLAKSARTALAILDTIKVDLILVDIEMPEISGFEFVDRLRSNPGHPEHKNIPIIFVTSHETPDIVKRVVSEGAGYAVKPVGPSLLEKINSTLAAAGKTDSTPA
jgi:PleD family two-component response regulator